MLGIRDNIKTVVHELCELRTCAAAEHDLNTSQVLDLTGYDDGEINALKRRLDYSVAELTDVLTSEVTASLENKGSFYIPPSLDTIIGKVFANNHISTNQDENRILIGNMLDRIFRLPIDQKLNNLHHPKSPTYRNTADIDPELSTLVKGLIVAPLFDALNEETNKQDIEDRWGRMEFQPERDSKNKTKEVANLENDPVDEYCKTINSMPDISIPYLFDQLKSTDNKTTRTNSMHMLSDMNLAYNAEQERILVDIVLKEASKMLQPPKKSKSEKLFHATATLAELEQLSYNPKLEELLKQVLLINKLDPDIHFNIFKILSKIQYGDILLERDTKTLLLKQATNEKDYSDRNFYAVMTLANNTKAISEQDLAYLLDAQGQADTDTLITALLIKIGQAREDLRPIILKSAWTKIYSTKDEAHKLFNCLDIIKELSQDRNEIDTFIKSKPLEQHTAPVLMLVLGLYEGLTLKYKLSRDPAIVELLEPLKNLVDGQGLFDNELVMKWYHLANHYKSLIKCLQSEDIDQGLQEYACHALATFMHNPELIDELKTLAIKSDNDELKTDIINLICFAATDLNHCLEYEANDPEAEPGLGTYTAIRLIQGNPNKAIRTHALDAILEIATKNRSPTIDEHLDSLVYFLGAEAYEQVIQTSSETPKSTKAQLAELIMLNSRYLRSRQYPVVA